MRVHGAALAASYVPAVHMSAVDLMLTDVDALPRCHAEIPCCTCRHSQQVTAQVGLGLVLHQADELIDTRGVPIDDLIAVGLLLYFGIRTLQVTDIVFVSHGSAHGAGHWTQLRMGLPTVAESMLTGHVPLTTAGSVECRREGQGGGGRCAGGNGNHWQRCVLHVYLGICS